ncbi:alpha-glucan phosphorylase, H isozyme isoform X1 [Physcomitrium patens]|uniref:alpha-glucan phosphorylase, H isozyme isoform X1 n=2 Tax=Physcomitrium patens TaxID=3218 RepID=UPI000D16B754|nr:alpha-1,4 glucan phosphorylase L isozyme, chloroplastic/amyloplastic-like isoform X1 [Physcomitrium patens]|eukprot:XP_024372040.1 alpha-1,4 glucan phosphorylase L isozyme, chloroplastic/amyloplastic-like isoform X1 [Physcomitrella patens]
MAALVQGSVCSALACPQRTNRFADRSEIVTECLVSKSSFLTGARLKTCCKGGLRCSSRTDVRLRPMRCGPKKPSKPGDQSNSPESPRSSFSKGDAATDPEGIVSRIKYHANYSSMFNPFKFELKQAYFAAAHSVRDCLIQRWNDTYKHFKTTNAKAVHYLSMEFLQGRALTNAIGNLELKSEYAQALRKLGHDLENVAEQEPDAALGNGGLGRLASCFLDSLATLNYPAWGYGLRYKYGLFHQEIDKDGQHEVVENWLEMGYPWEIARHDICYPIKFFGKTFETSGGKEWIGGEDIEAVAYDVPIPGYQTKNTICLRLWSTKVSPQNFDLDAFNAGDYDKAAALRNNAQRICHVLYPGDATVEGKLLRLKQQYTLCSASIQDMIARYKEWSGTKVDWNKFSTKVAIQMNDTHPTLCIPELMRILMDVEGLSWDQAWGITRATVAYTNHTVLPEALEKWPMPILQTLLPRHAEIIERIDKEFIKSLAKMERGTKLEEMVARMRVLENVERDEGSKKALEKPNPAVVKPSVEPYEDVKAKRDGTKKASIDKKTPVKLEVMVRMANLSVIAGNKVNGVAAIHSEILKNEVFRDFYKIWPGKFQNKTNGVTPRRWLAYCNPELSAVITKWLGSRDWVLHAELLAGLRKHTTNQDFLKEWRLAKYVRKQKLAGFIKERTGYVVNPNSMFDIQIKRIHEYKRQLMNIMGVIHRYLKMKDMNPKERAVKYVPRVCIFGGKAFATYLQAKRIVKLIIDVAAVVNEDPDIGELLKVIFVPDYNVSAAEMLIPASDLSQHISTAGMEASGTSNMKFAMNGCVLIGTLDGANVEIRTEVGADNFFLFGATVDQIQGFRSERAAGKFTPSKAFEDVKKFIRSGALGKYDYADMLESLEGDEGFGKADYFLVGKDFPDYVECQERIDKAYRNQESWTKMSILNTAGSSKFSSDRTIHEYAKEIWGVKPSLVP